MDELINLLKKERMTKEEVKHGVINLGTDPRDFLQEAIEEIIDCQNYLEWAFEKGQLDHVSYLKIDKSLRDVTVMLLSGQV
jgi:hypothetical protein